MITYIMNIATLAKKEDAYNEVVTNLYPIIIRTYDEEHLKRHIVELKDKIKGTLKSKYLYEHAFLYIRVIDGKDFKWKLSDIVKINYEENQ